MEFVDVLKKRHSVRHYQPQDVPDELVNKIVELAQTAPSAGGLRSYETFITRERIISIEAPVYLVVCADPERSASRYGDRGRNLYSLQDATICAAYTQLIAVDMGLASVWVGAFREGRVKRSLNIPQSLRPVVIVAIGYANEPTA